MSHPDNDPCVFTLEDRWNWLSSTSSTTGSTFTTNRLCDDDSQKNEDEQNDNEEALNLCHIPSVKQTWRKLREGPSGRCSHSLTAVNDHCLLLVGGGTSNSNIHIRAKHIDDTASAESDSLGHLDDLWMLNGLTVSWTKLHPVIKSPRTDSFQNSYWGMTFAPPRRGHMAACYQSKYLIVFGGMTDNDLSLNDTWVLHIPTLQWRRLLDGTSDSEPPPRRNGALCSYGNYLYLTAGHSEEPLTVWKFGPLSLEPGSITDWKWSSQATTNKAFLHKRAPKWPTVSLGPRPLRPLVFAASCVVGSKLWIFGGLEHLDEESMAPSNLLYRLDLESWEWSVLYAPFHCPCARYFHNMTSVGRFLVIMGGIGIHDPPEPHLASLDTISEDRQRDIFDVHFFDTDALYWKQAPSSKDWPCPRNGFGVTRLGSHNIIVHGGGVYPTDYYHDTFALQLQLPQKTDPPSLPPPHDPLCADLEQMYMSGLLSDVTFVVRDREFHVHKAFLASRCSFFRTMFTGPYAEASSTRVEFDAMPKAVDIVLLFLYTNRVETDEMPTDLISAVLQLVDFWNVPRLLTHMERALGLELQKQHCHPLELLAFAKAHHCSGLVVKCLDHCKRNDVVVNERTVDPELVAEIQDYCNSLM